MKAVNLNGYTVRDAANHVYTFGKVTIAANGGRVWLRTGKGTATARTAYWGSGQLHREQHRRHRRATQPDRHHRRYLQLEAENRPDPGPC